MLQNQSLPLPDTSDDICGVCGATAPFLLRTFATGQVERWCRAHLPDDWPLPKSLARMLEEEYISLKRRNESSPPVVAG